MQFSDEKLKNDFQKPNFIPCTFTPIERERGTALTAFLVFVTGGNMLALLAYCAGVNQVSNSALPALAFTFALQCGVLACVVGVWNWQKWGYYGLMAAYSLNMVASFATGSITMMIGSIIGLALLFGLVNDKLDMFD